MAIVLRGDEIREIENSISSKRQLEKQQREDKIKNIQYTISSKRQMPKQRRKDKIQLYEAAFIIASKLGFRDKVDTANLVQNNQLNISTTNIPLYYRGFKALREEIDLLKNRKSDDPFIDGLRDLQEQLGLLRSRNSDDPFIYGLRDLQVQLTGLHSIESGDHSIIGLRDLQEQLALLRSLKFEEEKLHAVNIDQAAYPPKNRVKPNRRLIVSLGTVAGLFLGIFLVFFVSFIQKQKGTPSE